VTNTSRELGAVFGVAVLGAVMNARLTGDLIRSLRALGIPTQFQSLVLQAVTTGAVPKGAGQGGGANATIVAQVIHAAYDAFGSGLDLALTLAGAMLLGAAGIAWVTTGRAESSEGRLESTGAGLSS
jgi:hypothetical protein